MPSLWARRNQRAGPAGGHPVSAAHDAEQVETLADADVLALMRVLQPVVENRRHCGLRIEDAEVYARTILASPWLADLIAKERADAARAALNEAANKWTQGAWSDVMLPKPTPPAVPVIAYSNRVGDWLRSQAARIARGGER